MIRKITHACEGTCSRQIEIEVEDGIVRSVAFTGGCHGNQQGVAYNPSHDIPSPGSRL